MSIRNATTNKVINWECPHCNSNRLEEVLVNVVQSSEITDISSEGYLDYGNFSTEGGELERYQCLDCGFIVAHTTEELLKILNIK